MKILFLHAWQSVLGSVKPTFLAQHGHTVLNLKLPDEGFAKVINLWLTGPDTLGLWQSAPTTRVGLPVIGGALVCLGLMLMVATIQLFVTVGEGDAGPVEPDATARSSGRLPPCP